MSALGAWLFGVAGYPVAALVWSNSGAHTSLVLAGLLVLSVAALVWVRDKGAPVAGAPPTRRQFIRHDHRLPSAA